MDTLTELRDAVLYPFFDPKDRTQPRFRTFNTIVAWIHFVQAFVIIVMNQIRFRHIPANRIFVSSFMNLTFPNHMLHVYDGSADPTKCTEALDVIQSDAFQASPHLDNGEAVIRGAGDSILLDVRNTILVEFSINTARLNVPEMIICFFLLSWGFQLFNGWYTARWPNGPRYIQYVEYSISGSLTIVVMALNTGILDLFTVLSIFILFFGMNIFGVLAEFMMAMAEKWYGKLDLKLLSLGSTVLVDFTTMWLIPHLCGWALFLFAWLPIAVKYTKTQACAENSQGKGVPPFIAAAIVMESVCYFLFGVVQFIVLVGRTRALDSEDKIVPCFTYTWKELLDVCTIVLSLVAKTFLAWALMGPAWVAKTD
jgi:hypothetical protein